MNRKIPHGRTSPRFRGEKVPPRGVKNRKKTQSPAPLVNRQKAIHFLRRQRMRLCSERNKFFIILREKTAQIAPQKAALMSSSGGAGGTEMP